MTGRADICDLEQRQTGCCKDLQVKPKAPTVDVLDIESQAFVPPDGIAAVDLCKARHAWWSVVPTHLLGGITSQVFHQQGTRPDYIGGFVVGIHGADEFAEELKKAGDDYGSIMVKAIADRFAPV